ncbi:unnamed protein product, partial [Ascophyllum nodosum]
HRSSFIACFDLSSSGTSTTQVRSERERIEESRRILCSFPVVQQYILSVMKRYGTFFVVHQFVVVVVSQIQRIGCQPEKNFFYTVARRRERQRDWESCNRTRKRRGLRSDTHWPS